MRTPLQILRDRRERHAEERAYTAWLERSLHVASSRAAASDVDPAHRSFGIGQDWTNPLYVDYYSQSAPIYAAIKVRAMALSRAKLKVYKSDPTGHRDPVRSDHPLQLQFDRPNDHMTGQELIIGTETYLGIWGKSHWSIETINGRETLWPLRPDRLYTLPGKGRTFIQGYRYQGTQGDVTYLPEEIVTFSYFNPAQDRAGHSPIAPLRLTADMNLDALKYNRQTFRNGGIPDFIIFAEGVTNDAEVQKFYERWDKRFGGPDKSHRPAIGGGFKDMKTLAFSNRDMEYAELLRWYIEETSRTYGVPRPFLGDTTDATLANIDSLEKIFWRTHMIPEALMIEAKINHDLLPKLGWEGYEVSFDLSTIEVLAEEEEARIARETAYLDRKVLVPNEVRDARGWQPIEGGDEPLELAPQNIFDAKPPTP